MVTVTPSDELRALAETLGARATLMKPLGPMTTYGVGGPAALFVEVDGPADLDAVRPVLAERSGAARRSSSSGGAPTCWWPTPASTGSSSISGPGFARLDLPGPEADAG